MPLDPQTGLPVNNANTSTAANPTIPFDPLSGISIPTNNIVAPDLSSVILPDASSPFSDAEYAPEEHLTPTPNMSTTNTSTVVMPEIITPIEQQIPSQNIPYTQQSIPEIMATQQDISVNTVSESITQTIPSESLVLNNQSVSNSNSSYSEQSDNIESNQWITQPSESYHTISDTASNQLPGELSVEETPNINNTIENESTYEDDRWSDDHADLPITNSFYELTDVLKELLSLEEYDQYTTYTIEWQSTPDTHIQYWFLLIDSWNGLRIEKTTQQWESIKKEMLTFEYDIVSFTMNVLLNDNIVYTEWELIETNTQKDEIIINKITSFIDMIDSTIDRIEQERDEQRKQQLEQEREQESQRQQAEQLQQLQQF